MKTNTVKRQKKNRPVGLADLADVRAAVESGAIFDVSVLALTLWGESRGESLEGRIAVASVIRNRANEKSWYGKGIAGVCLKRWQFSCWLPQGGESNFKQLMAMANKSYGVRLKNLAYRECDWIAQGICAGDVRDQVKRSNHYYVDGASTPKWAVGQTPVLQLGTHLFFRL